MTTEIQEKTEMVKEEETPKMKIVINGGKEEIQSATLTVEWRFSEEIIAKKPTHILILEQTEKETNDLYHQKLGRRYVCEVSRIVEYLQFFSPGIHRVSAFALASTYPKDVAGFIEKMLKQDGGKYTSTLSRKDVVGGVLEYPIIAATTVEIGLPDDGLFAQKPEGRFGKFVWDWVNRWFEETPRDECHFRKRAIFAFTVQPILFIVGMFFKHLIGGIICALYILIASLTVFIFGYRPKPILKGIWQAFLLERSDASASVLEHEEYRLWRYEGRKKVYLPITPIELLLLAFPIVVYCLIIKKVAILSFPILLQLLVGISGPFLLVGFFCVIRVLFRRFLTSLNLNLPEMPRVFKIDWEALAKEQEFKKAQKTKKIEEAKQREEEEQLDWLKESFSLGRIAANGNYKLLPKPRSRNEETKLHFRVSVWTLKSRICKPYSQ